MEENEVKEYLKIDLGTVDHSLTEFPWPYESGSAEEIVCLHVFNKIPSKLRGDFMDEAWRVLKPEGKLTVIVPYYSSMRAYADFAYEWPPLSEMAFLYFNKEWRTNNKVHSELVSDFDFTFGYFPDPETQTRAPEVQADWYKHRLNSASDVQVNMVKRG